METNRDPSSKPDPTTGDNIDLNAESISTVSDSARKECFERMLNRSFRTDPPTLYEWSKGTMTGLVRKSLDCEPGHFTVVFCYWSSSDTFRRTDLHFSESGEVLKPSSFKHKSFEDHSDQCLRTVNAIAVGTLDIDSL